MYHFSAVKQSISGLWPPRASKESVKYRNDNRWYDTQLHTILSLWKLLQRIDPSETDFSSTYLRKVKIIFRLKKKDAIQMDFKLNFFAL